MCHIMATSLNGLYFQKLSGNAVTPRKYTEGSAGYDLSSSQNAIVWPQKKCVIRTDIAVALPPGYFGKLFDR